MESIAIHTRKTSSKQDLKHHLRIYPDSLELELNFNESKYMYIQRKE